MMEVMVDPAATFSRFVDIESPPENKVKGTDCDCVPQYAVIIADPGSVPGIKVTVAYP